MECSVNNVNTRDKSILPFPALLPGAQENSRRTRAGDSSGRGACVRRCLTGEEAGLAAQGGTLTRFIRFPITDRAMRSALDAVGPLLPRLMTTTPVR